MSSVFILKCNTCKFSTRVAGGFPFYINPVTHEQVFPMVPIPLELKDRIDGYRNTEYCVNCRKDVTTFSNNDRSNDKRCPTCNGNALLQEDDICPECHKGRIELDNARTAWF